MKLTVNERKDLGDYLAEKRRKIGLTQLEVAAKLGYSSSQFISNWERGLSLPALDSFPKLAELYQIDPNELIDLLLETHQKGLQSMRRDMHRVFSGYAKNS